MKVFEIFPSIDGEVNGFAGIGQFSIFVRLGGCNLNCKWCDTQYARPVDSNRYQELSCEEVFETVMKYHIPKVTITGGEPFLQKEEVLELVDELISFERLVTIETNGSYSIPLPKPNYVGFLRYVVDYKLPSSGCEECMNLENFNNLSNFDYVKFVVSDLQDYQRAKEVIRDITHRFIVSPRFAFSPQVGKMKPERLAKLILEDLKKEAFIFCKRDVHYDVHFNVQLHKLIGVK